MEYRYKQSYRVRHDECNLYGELTPAATLRYLQDIAGLDAAPTTKLADGNWVARRTIMEFIRPIQPWVNIEIGTYLLGFSKVTAYRGYDLLVEGQADPAIRARTLWVYLDSRGRPARIPASFHDYWEWDHLLEPQDEPPLPPKPTYPGYSTHAEVKFSHIDILSHMNNAAYVELLDDEGWQILDVCGVQPGSEAGHPVPLSYDIEYLQSAKFADPVNVVSWFRQLEPATFPRNPLFQRFQIAKRRETVLLRAVSNWHWQAPAQAEPFPARFDRIFDKF